MKTKKIKFIAIFALAVLIIPSQLVFALQMPQSSSDLADMYGINAQAYVVEDVKTGQILVGKNMDMPWTPASLTKLVTALVVLDTKPKLTRVVSMTSADQIAGACNAGGACVKAASGVRFTIDGLFHAALMPSANNAANALARSTGLSQQKFVARMNAKVKALGAANTSFNEPTGMDPNNKTTAADYAKIVTAAFTNSYLRKIAQTSAYTLRSTNNRKYTQLIKNSDKLLTTGPSRIQMLGAKTGYLDESQYNFAALLKYDGGSDLAVVVLGEPHLYIAFDETKTLAKLATEARDLAAANLISLTAN